MVSFGHDVDFDSSPIAYASASASLGFDFAVLAGDRVKLRQSAGRVLDLDEEAVVLGTFQGQLYSRVFLRKTKGQSCRSTRCSETLGGYGVWLVCTFFPGAWGKSDVRPTFLD